MLRRTPALGTSKVVSLVDGKEAKDSRKAYWELLQPVGEIFPWLAPVASGALAAASFPPFQKGFLAWFALTPLFLALRGRAAIRAAFCAWLFGCTFAVGAFFWVNSITSVSVPGFMLMVAMLSLYFTVYGFVYVFLDKAIGPLMILGAPALWVAMEYVRSNFFFLSLPWNLLGHSQYRYLMVIQVADLAGVYGISFVVVMVNELLSRIPDALSLQTRGQTDRADVPSEARIWKIQFLFTTLVLTVVLLYGGWRLSSLQAQDHIRVGLVQTGEAVRHLVKRADQENILNTFQKLSKVTAKENPELIVWPASSLPAPITTSSFVRNSVMKLAEETQAYLLVGSSGFEKLKPLKQGERPYSCSEFVVSPTGQIDGPYNKIRLLPFDEYLPLQGFIHWPKWITSLKEGFLPGDSLKLFQAGPAKFGTPICWENMFPDFFREFVANGANLMISVTNEGFMEHSRAQYQTLAINVFRAVENRVAVIRAGSVGVSAVIDPSGSIVERIHDEVENDLFVSGFIVREVPLLRSKSFYTHHGDIFAVLMIGIAMLSIFIALRSKRPS